MSNSFKQKPLTSNLPTNGEFIKFERYVDAITEGGENTWKLYLWQLKYFSNLWKLTGHASLERQNDKFWYVLINYGTVALQYFKAQDEFAIMTVTDIELDLYDNVKQATVTPITITGGMQTTQVKDKGKQVNGNDIVIIKWDTYGNSLMFYLYSYLQQLSRLYDTALINANNKIKKFKVTIKSRDMDRIHTEINELLSAKPYYLEINPSMDNEGKISKTPGTKIEQAPQSGFANIDVWSDITEFMKFIYNFMGRRNNNNNKKERNITSEFASESAVFDVLEHETIFQIEKGIKSISKKFNIDISYEPTVEQSTELDKNLETPVKEVKNEVK